MSATESARMPMSSRGSSPGSSFSPAQAPADTWIPAAGAGMMGVLWATVLAALVVWLLGAEPARAAELELPVPRVTIYPGEVIGDGQLVERAFIARTVARATVHEAREALIGKVARRTLLPGQPIPLAGIRDPYVVTQGKTALAVLEAGGLTITLNAMVLQNGGIGDVVSVRNIDSGTIIKGTVAPDGTVRLAAP